MLQELRVDHGSGGDLRVWSGRVSSFPEIGGLGRANKNGRVVNFVRTCPVCSCEWSRRLDLLRQLPIL